MLPPKWDDFANPFFGFTGGAEKREKSFGLGVCRFGDLGFGELSIHRGARLVTQYVPNQVLHKCLDLAELGLDLSELEGLGVLGFRVQGLRVRVQGLGL